MNFLLSQSFEQHFQRGRLFEHVGYFLAVLAFVILAGAVAWSIGKRLERQRQFVFRAASLSALALFQLVVTTGLTIHYFWSSGPGRQQEARAVVRPVDEPPATAALAVDVAADGTLSVDERPIRRGDLAAFLQQTIAHWSQQGISPENATVELRCDPRLPTRDVVELVNTCNHMGVRLRISKAQSSNGQPTL